ncbi:MAG: hypothetical protein PVF91_00335 [Chromatiales bacterium]|jgi:hypothetical protein
MSRVSIAIAVAGIAAMLAMPVHQAEAWWGPWYGTGWRNSYVYDPAYRYAPPQMKQYIRDLYLRGPGYATWREHRRHPYRYWW